MTKEERVYITKMSGIPKYVNGTETIAYRKKNYFIISE